MLQRRSHYSRRVKTLAVLGSPMPLTVNPHPQSVSKSNNLKVDPGVNGTTVCCWNLGERGRRCSPIPTQGRNFSNRYNIFLKVAKEERNI